MLNLLVSGLELMLLGMGIVFTFLSLLVLVLHSMTGLVNKYIHPKSTTTAYPQKIIDTGAITDSHLAAISAAIVQFRQAHLKH